MPPRVRGRVESRSPARATGAKAAPRERSRTRSASRTRTAASRAPRAPRARSTSRSRPESQSKKNSATSRGRAAEPAKPAESKPTRAKAAPAKKAPAKPVSRSSRARAASPAPARGRPRTRSQSRGRLADEEEDEESEESEKEEQKPVKAAPRSRRRGAASPAKVASKGSDEDEDEDEDEEKGKETVLVARHMRAGPPTPTRTPQRPAALPLLRPSDFAIPAPAATPAPAPAAAAAAAAAGSNSLGTASVIAFYFATSLFVVFVNKALFTATSPSSALFLTWVQIAAAVALAVIAGALAAASGSPALARVFPRFHTSLALQLHALPLSLVFTALLLANNLCLAYVHISFYQVARAWTVVFNIILAFLLFRVRPSSREILCCLIVAAGYIIACDSALPSLVAELSGLARACVKPALVAVAPAAAAQWLGATGAGAGAGAGEVCSVSAPLWGLIYGLLGSLLLSLYSLMIKRSLTALPIPDGVLAGAVNVNASLLLAALLPWLGTGNIPAFSDVPFWTSVAAVSAAGYLLNIATYLQIKHTSALTHNVSGTAKASVQSVLGWLRYRNPVSLLTAAGTAATIFGCALYAYVRGQQPRPAASAEGEGEAKGVAKVTAAADATLPMPKWAQCIARTAHRFIVPPPAM